jgi:hypothetical protein
MSGTFSSDRGENYIRRYFGENPISKRKLGRERKRWEDNIEPDLKEISVEDVKWIEFAQDCVQRQFLLSCTFNLRILLPAS